MDNQLAPINTIGKTQFWIPGDVDLALVDGSKRRKTQKLEVIVVNYTDGQKWMTGRRWF